MNKTLLLASLLLLAIAGRSEAQNISIQACQPYSSQAQPSPCQAPSSTQTGAAIAVTNTFQVALALNSTTAPSGATGTRSSCLLQNNGTHNMFVYFKKSGGVIASLTAALVLLPSYTINCLNTAGQILQEEIDITGTSGDTYALIVQ